MDDLLIKYVLGEATDDEAAQVERWLRVDAANRKRLEQYRSVWALGRRMAVEEGARVPAEEGARVPVEDAWEARRWLKRTPGQEQGEQVRRFGWLRVAAVTTGALLLGAGGYLLFKPHRQVAVHGPVIGTVQRGGDRAIEAPRTVKLAGARPVKDTLPDGTVFTLNRGASLAIVGGTVEKGLTVRLQGEAFFSVKHDPSRAFVVQVGAVEMKVLGTSFEVNEISDDSIELVVEAGAVRVAETGAVRVGGKGAVRVGDRGTVHGGERLRITGKDGWKIGPIRDKLYGYYLGRPLVCDSVPLRRLVEVLNRADDTPIVLGRKAIGDLPLTTVFRGKSPDRILEVVALTFNLSIVRRGSEIILQ